MSRYDIKCDPSIATAKLSFHWVRYLGLSNEVRYLGLSNEDAAKLIRSKNAHEAVTEPHKPNDMPEIV